MDWDMLAQAFSRKIENNPYTVCTIKMLVGTALIIFLVPRAIGQTGTLQLGELVVLTVAVAAGVLFLLTAYD